MRQNLYLLFQVVSSIKKCLFGLETTCFDGIHAVTNSKC